MNLTSKISESTFYWASLIVAGLFAFSYFWRTIRKDKNIYWYIYEDGDRKIDFGFCKKIVVQLVIVFFAFFTFFNVIFFCIQGKWVTGNNFQSSKSFVIIGAVAYIFDLIEKSNNILYEQKQKKVKISKEDVKHKNESEKLKEEPK